MPRPSVTICMAIYKPNIKWLKEQLCSIDNQKYDGDIDLIIWNDSPQYFRQYEIINKCMKNIAWKIYSNGINNGIVKSFELLTLKAKGEYIAYCDQDDVWCENKISISIERLLENRCNACCCSAQIIDENGKKGKYIINEVNDKNRLQRIVLTGNTILGCELLIESKIAREAIPFPHITLHDAWLLMYTIAHGSVFCAPDILLYYRRHGGNNSGCLLGIDDKYSYKKEKIFRTYKLLRYAGWRLKISNEIKTEIKWAKARVDYAQHVSIKNFMSLIRNVNIRSEIVVFELLLPIVNFKLGKRFIKVLKSKRG